VEVYPVEVYQDEEDVDGSAARRCDAAIAERRSYCQTVLHLDASAYSQMIALAYDDLPLEACGLLGGSPGVPGIPGAPGPDRPAKVTTFYPSVNVAGSSKVYTIDPKTHLRAERDAEQAGNEIVGVMHSHTHTDPYPSPTDIAQAPDPSWHYIIVSLRDTAPMLRSYRIVDGQVVEEPVVVGP
jgi:[CysO sulfur-carrier protein]-S-L-cysteine hydrolase